MSTETQFNPNIDLNQKLVEAGASKTVYALVTAEIELAKSWLFSDSSLSDERSNYYAQFRGAWTGKQDAVHEEFRDTWIKWSEPAVDFPPASFPFFYPTAGASEALRHLIYDWSIRAKSRTMIPRIHVFEGEYEGYKAYAEAAGVKVVEWPRSLSVAKQIKEGELFFLSQPSAINGYVWREANAFLNDMPRNSVVIDLTYVGATHEYALRAKIDLTAPSIRNIVFSLSKSFGAYYDRIGGVFCQQEDLGLFGNKWFKNLSSLQLGTKLMKSHDVFYMPWRYRALQADQALATAAALKIEHISPADVFLLATADKAADPALDAYLRRPAKTGLVRLCLTPGMAKALGTAE
jgi:histidinol-phosphate/aromatic aminotransferase/cobyric acid decarboxylase-like protein